MIGIAISSRARTGRLLRRIAIVAAAAGVGTGALFSASGCSTIAPFLIDATLRACLQLISSLFDAPVQSLPPGYSSCGTNTWQLPDRSITFCAYCPDVGTGPVYVQMECQGPFYPLVPRRLDEQPTKALAETISIESYDCEDRFLAEIGAMVDVHRQRAEARLVVPSGRVLADRSAYSDLEVLVDGVEAPVKGDFHVASGTKLWIAGTLQEVAHYAMTAGVEELSFSDGADRWTVYANAEWSAVALYRNDVFEDARFLFAPMP